MKLSDSRVTMDPEFGFRRLDPLPEALELEEFYSTNYAGEQTSAAPDIKRLREQDDAANQERQWRFETLYTDVMAHVSTLGIVGGRALDVGSGTGEFLRFLGDHAGWTAAGIEPDQISAEAARQNGLNVIAADLVDVDDSHCGAFDLITMFNVLEHVPDPRHLLDEVLRFLAPDGVIVVQVPNDFTLIQGMVVTALDAAPWWVAIPDHINYFDYDSLSALLESRGLDIRVKFGSFPMEFFLIAGLDYLADPSAGWIAHQRRCAFEMAISGDQRRAFNQALASGGLGRNAIVIAQHARSL